MKKISVVLFSLGLTLAFGQKVTDYKYIAVPDKFKDFEKESYGLESFLSKNLTSKKYIVISSDKSKWPSEIGNPCNVLHAEVLNASSFLKNKVKVQFNDCHDKTVSEAKGGSSIKEFQEGYSDALRDALIGVASSNPTVNLAAVESTPSVTQPVRETPAQNQAKETAATTFTTSSATKFTNGKINLQKIQLADDQFILADANSSVPYATFKATAKKEVFRVKLANGESTLGYIENGSIIIEMPQANGDFTRDVFTGK